ncbi:MAG: TraB/GumN family protein [Proteobacteria bacterium]|nr:MAG: TraB/GumN family protein [Pseudomonadota bacterium]
MFFKSNDRTSVVQWAAVGVLMLAGAVAQAKSSVWKVEKDGQHIYLGGTVHVLSKDDYPLPREYERAYQQSKSVFFEVDFARMQDPAVMQSILSVLKAKDGETLDKVLKPETMKALKAFMEKRGLPMAVINDTTPAGASLVLMSMELMLMGMTDAGVDAFFDAKARRDNKTLGKMETVEEQMAFFAKMDEGDADELILYTLRDLDNMPKIMADLKNTWRSGDRAEYRRLLLGPWIRDYPQAYQSLLVERNKNWLPKIEALFETPEVELVLVGALHMVGKDGLLQQLERKGYNVEPFAAVANEGE